MVQARHAVLSVPRKRLSRFRPPRRARKPGAARRFLESKAAARAGWHGVPQSLARTGGRLSAGAVRLRQIGRAALIGLSVVTDALRKDPLQSRPVGTHVDRFVEPGIERFANRLQRALEMIATYLVARDGARIVVDRIGLHARAGRTLVPFTVPYPIAAEHRPALRIDTTIARGRRTQRGPGLFGTRASGREPSLDRREGLGSRIVLPVADPDRLVSRLPLCRKEPHAHRKGRRSMVHVQHRFQIVAHVDDRNVEAPEKDLARSIRCRHRQAIALEARRRRVAGLAAIHVVRAPRREIIQIAAGSAQDPETLALHLGDGLPGADTGIEAQELLDVDLPTLERPQAVLDSHVVPRDARIALRIGAVEILQILEIAPLHTPEHPSGKSVLDERKARVQHQWRQPAPADHAFSLTLGVRHPALTGQQGEPGRRRDGSRLALALVIVAGVETFDPLPVFGVVPQRIAAVGPVEVILQQFAIERPDGLGDHVGIRILRNRSIDQAGTVLRQQILLDRATGPAHADRILRFAI
ncbi:hypothetical protein ebA3125 [Aromatoleum aromaticum EbN1]|uniref:Uncharacterized protein n=1 Tax=Aromatoleum aromaticum (strain DSM 19018 / LMG 30748 / EbN1) TaxID=76114 RepID=Q5P487_AROAE|nr:hypothetical protein ebA3125 [Aromatoleum aromaticum EbN1]